MPRAVSGAGRDTPDLSGASSPPVPGRLGSVTGDGSPPNIHPHCCPRGVEWARGLNGRYM